MNFHFAFHKTLEQLHVGTEPPHAYFIPYPSEKEATDGIRAANGFFKTLCGDWRFRFYRSEYELDDFLKPDFCAASFDRLTVPVNWQMELERGYDAPVYMNTDIAIPFDPPHIPVQTPCGLYIRDFILPQVPAEQEFYLTFEGVDSCFYLFLNNAFVGYSQVSHCSSEFNVTKLLRAGTNEIKVLVFKWCTGTYLEVQDKYRLSGIFREVYLLTRPRNHIRDIYIRQSFSADFRRAALHVELALTGSTETAYTLRSPDGEALARGAVSGQNPVIEETVDEPLLWSDETPLLYSLILECEGEYIVQKIGFRDLRIKNRVIFLNGQKIKAKGVNRHDSDAYMGYTSPMDAMLQDLYMMKRYNINMIRTSHYPNDPRFLELCDRLGFYVISENDLECHNCAALGDWDILTDSSDWTESYLDRVERMFERDKNHTCIVIWSLGNEFGVGENQKVMYRYLHDRMPGCIVHCEDPVIRWAEPNLRQRNIYQHYKQLDSFAGYTDVVSLMYWSPEDCERYILKNEAITMPLFLCEYAHAMGNSLGDIGEYWELINRFDSFFGGCVWEFSDHAVAAGENRFSNPQYRYGGDFKEPLHFGSFCVDGLTAPNRTPHSGMLELKQALKPFAVTGFCWENFSLLIKNRRYFTSLADCDLVWYAEQEGVRICEGKIPALNIPPQAEQRITLGGLSLDRARDAYLTVSLISNASREYAPAGHSFGFEQISIPADQFKQGKARALTGQAAVYDGSREVTAAVGETVYRFSRISGLVTSICDNGREMLASPICPTVWRAPIDNDRNIRAEWEKAGYRDPQINCLAFTYEQTDEKLKIHAELAMAKVSQRPFLRLSVGYTVFSSGELEIFCRAVRLNYSFRHESPFLPRFGFAFEMPQGNEKLSYFGRGPGESYEDKRLAAQMGVYRSTVTAHFEHYIRPQENMAHSDTHWVSVTNLQGHGLLVYAPGSGKFSFNCSHFTPEYLTRTAHDYELVPICNTAVNIDYRQSGIGSNSCGPELKKEYRIDEKKFDWSFRLRPWFSNNENPFDSL